MAKYPISAAALSVAMLTAQTRPAFAEDAITHLSRPV
jgi:hypothetical protein